MSRTAHISLAGLSAVAVAFGLARYGYGLFVPVFREAFDLSTEMVGFLASGAYASYLVALIVTWLAPLLWPQ
jgi:hypothetical protein